MKNIYIILLILMSGSLFAQTPLGPGDVVFTLINTAGNNEDALAFVLLKDVTSGTRIVITDDEYTGGALTTGEGRVEIAFNASFTCGTEIFVQDANPDMGIYVFQASTGPGNTAGLSTTNVGTGDLSLSTAGETLIAFQDANSNTTTPASFISALANTGVGFGAAATGSGDLPPGLVVGSSALALPANTSGDEFDNYKYNCAITSGTPGQIATGVYTAGNWNGDDAAAFPVSGCGFSCAAACNNPTLTGISASPASSCPGTTVTINIDGNLGDAAEWRLHEGSCSGAIIESTSGSSFTVNPAGTTDYFVTVLDCNGMPICRSTTVTRSVQSADAGPDQLLVAGVSTNLAANAAGAGSGMWDVVTGDGAGTFGNEASPTSSFTGTAGQSYTLSWTISGGGCPTTTAEVEISFVLPTTDLAAGDLAFIGYNSDAPDEFSFVVLREINAGTEVFFTDMGWQQSGGFRSSAEGLILLTFDRSYSCGDAFYLTRPPSPTNNWVAFDESGGSAGTVSIPAVPNRNPEIGTIGDQVFAFQGTLGNPTLLAGIHVGEAWSDATDNSSSAQPAALTGNNTSVNLTQDVDNGIFDCSVTSGVPTVLRTAINNASNWNLSADLIPLTPACNFNCQDCAEPVITSLSASPDPVCAGQSTTITVTGDLMGAAQWVVYAPDDCGGTELASSTGGNTITFTPDGTGTYLVAGIDGCVATPACSPVTITQTGEPAAITMQKPTTKVSATAVALTAAPLGAGQTGTWSIVSGSDNGGSITDPGGPGAMLTGTAGNGYLLRYTASGNGCPETTDEVFVSFLVDGGVSFGGMVFTGYNSQPTDNFSVVVLESLTAGTAFSVTDNGWLAAGGFRPGEETANYLLCRPLGCGDNIRFEPDGNGYAPDGTVVAELQNGSTFPVIGSIGDQLFLYSGFTAPTAGDLTGFVSAIQMNCENGTCDEANWDGDAIDNSASAKPSVFTSSNSVFGGTNPTDNGRYDCANGTNNENDLFALVNNDANWSFQNGAFTLDGCDFVCDPPPVAVCQDITVEIDANGNPTTNGQFFMASDLDGGSTDNGSIDPSGFSVDITPGCANVTNPVSATTITLTVTDNLGQTATCTSQVTVEDNAAPTITCLTEYEVELEANGEFFLDNNTVNNILTLSFTDNCSATPFNFGSNRRTMNCTDVGTPFAYNIAQFDDNGQNAICTVMIIVTDPNLYCDEDPLAVCQDAVAQIDANGNLVLDPASLDGGSTDDNTAAADLDFSIDFGGLVLDCDDVDMPAQTVTLMVTDNVGQSSTCTSQVTVEDNIAPVITCQNVAVDLLADGTFNSGGFSNFFLSNVLTSFSDNCAPTAHPFIGAFQLAFGCADIGINNESYFFRDRMLGATSREDRCDVLIQINDPLGVCGSDPVVDCQDFTAGPDANGNYTLDANSLDNGSTDDRSVYSLVFSDETATIGNPTEDNNFPNVGYGQSFTATITGAIQTIKVRFFAATSGVTLHLYNGAQGSGIPGSIGTPVYSQAGVELFAGPTGGYTSITLNEPFPVVAGQQYTFVFEGVTHPYYDGDGGGAYTGGEALFGYATGFSADLQFEVDFIGPTTQQFSGDGVYPVTVYAVDDQGNLSGACNATFILDQSLPVAWLSFGANAGAKTVDLRWETSVEPDNAGFHVERSATGSAWAAIGEVPARAGSDQRYDFTDDAPLNGVSYYRLRQTDFDGQVTYSPVETVAFYANNQVVIFPNPATSEVSVRLPEGAELLGLLDVTGRATTVRFDGQNGQLTTNVSALPAGVYFLRVRLADGELSARRLMVR